MPRLLQHRRPKSNVCFALGCARSQGGCSGVNVPLPALMGEGNTRLPEHTCKMCSFSLLKHRSLTELPSWELKCCLGLKPKVMNFRYWNILSASHPPLPPAYCNFQVKNQHSPRNPEVSKVTQTALWRLFLLAKPGKALWKTRQCSACKGNPGSKISKVKFNQFF